MLAQDIAETLATDTQQERLLRPPASTNATQEETLWLQLLAKMTGHVVVHLPNIWQLVQVSTTVSHDRMIDVMSDRTRLIKHALSQ